MTLNGNWHEAPDRFVTEILPVIRRNSEMIISLFDSGDADAAKVVHSYHRLQRGFDPVTDRLLRDALSRMGLLS